jgi:hypothetical protein
MIEAAPGGVQTAPAGSPLRRQARVLELIVVGGYLLVAYGVHHLYPFYVFDMYDQQPPASTSRLVARDAEGRLRDVIDYAAWSCEGPLDRPLEPCSAEHIAARDGEAERYVDRHRAGAGEGDPVDLVRHALRFDGTPAEPGLPGTTGDFVVQHCRAVLK